MPPDQVDEDRTDQITRRAVGAIAAALVLGTGLAHAQADFPNRPALLTQFGIEN